MSKLERILFAGGGTGGHVFMAVAVAQELKRQDSTREILFVGTRQGLEARLVEPLGFKLETINIGGLNRVGITRALGTLTRLPFTIIQGAGIVRRFSPSIIVGVGGYSSGPVVLGGKLIGYHAVVIEPNAFPGMANRFLTRWVDGAAVAFEEAARGFGAKARLTGIPIRREFHSLESRISETGPLRLLVFGGSQGSRPINTLMCEAIKWLPADRVEIVHQTGQADHERVRGCYEAIGRKADVVEFIPDMPQMFARTDLIVSRAGASTVAELTVAGKAAILIPFPNAADDHQRKNALALEKRHAAIVLEQEKTTGRELADSILRLADNRDELRSMATASKQLARPDSVDKILELMQEVAGGGAGR
ncbi:MAG: undecaprenyldiphospho-muramoylpentapeptide beta-N-acetylglucosaminyltransferase [Acidobacteria bacterium]|nr:MAG: undecaprenyldiphospho-muramoylpentapeptide beta-N-acetylglucosaminyltransferase [Acidobacteriota bacterium]